MHKLEESFKFVVLNMNGRGLKIPVLLLIVTINNG